MEKHLIYGVCAPSPRLTLAGFLLVFLPLALLAGLSTGAIVMLLELWRL